MRTDAGVRTDFSESSSYPSSLTDARAMYKGVISRLALSLTNSNRSMMASSVDMTATSCSINSLLHLSLMLCGLGQRGDALFLNVLVQEI